MKNIVITIAVLISNFLVVPTSLGDELGQATLEGNLFSASATIATGRSSAVLTRVPGGMKLIVTQFCKSSFFGPELVGSVLGRVPAEGSACTTYIPGVVFNGGESISCVSNFGPVFQDIACLINGVIRSRKIE